MILGAMRTHVQSRLGRTLWVALLLCAGAFPILHAAHHLDSTTYCPVCHFARGGVPALARGPISIAPLVVSVPVTPRPAAQPLEGPRSPTAGIRGPPASSPA
jgi:hypothetical protein